MANQGKGRSRFSLRRSSKKTTSQQRRMFLENLEDRRLLAVGPQLVGVQTNDGDLLREDRPDQIRTIAPRELTFRFDENQQFDVHLRCFLSFTICLFLICMKRPDYKNLFVYF